MTSSNINIARAVYSLYTEKDLQEQKEVSIKVVKFLSRKRLLSKSSQILSEIGKIIDQEEERITAKVFSAEEIDNRMKLYIKQALKKYYRVKEVVLEEMIDKSLLGGIKLKVNDEVIDFSIKNRIVKLQKHLIYSI